jgi:PhnB protein
MGVRGPKSIGRSPVAIHVYVDDVDDTFDKALSAGATTLRPVEDKFYGDRGGEFEDPFGHRWSIASHIEDLSTEEMERRMGQLPG